MCMGASVDFVECQEDVHLSYNKYMHANNVLPVTMLPVTMRNTLN